MVERQGYYSREGSLRSKRFVRVFCAKRGARAKKLPAPKENPTEMLTACTQVTGEPGWRFSVCFPRFSHWPVWPSDLGYELIMRNGRH